MTVKLEKNKMFSPFPLGTSFPQGADVPLPSMLCLIHPALSLTGW